MTGQVLPGVMLAALAAVGGCGVNEGQAMDRNPRSTDQPRPRDGDIAVREELDAARRAGSVEAYDLFLSRHADHLLAEAARRERAELLRRQPR